MTQTLAQADATATPAAKLLTLKEAAQLAYDRAYRNGGDCTLKAGVQNHPTLPKGVYLVKVTASPFQVEVFNLIGRKQTNVTVPVDTIPVAEPTVSMVEETE